MRTRATRLPNETGGREKGQKSAIEYASERASTACRRFVLHAATHNDKRRRDARCLPVDRKRNECDS